MTPGVPQVIHRVWLRDPMPAQVAEAGDTIRRLHPGWEVLDWTDPDALPPLRNQDMFDAAAHWCPRDPVRFESDLLRLELLWRYGGIYLDTDVQVGRHLSELVDGRRCVVARSPQHIGGHHPITNCVMASVPAHPWIGRLIHTLPQAAIEHRGRPLAQQIGPWHLTRMYEGEPWPSVTVLSEHMFSGDLLTHGWNSGRRRRGEADW